MRTWVIGIVALVVIVFVMLNSLRDRGAEPGGPREGDRLPPFAVPAAASDLEGDANVATPETVGEAAGTRPACEVRGPDVVNVCALAERGPVVLALFPAGADRCAAVVEQLGRLAEAYGDRVAFVAVGSRGDRRELVDRGVPRGVHLGWDRDGAVAARYGLASCPQVTFADEGGRVAGTVHRALDDAELERRVRELVR